MIVNRNILVVFFPLCLFLLAGACSGDKTEKATVKVDKPNIIYILADDLGYGDLSCYGQAHFQTPNLDNMANEGMLFTRHYAGCTVCAPSRSSLLTGLTTGHTPIRGNKEIQPEGQWPITDSTFTMAEMLKDAGYTTGAFGKWGLGFPGSEGDPNKQGFDEFYGYNCQRMAHNYYPEFLWDNNKKVHLKGNSGNKFETYAPELIHERALEFIEKNKDRPFFLYYPNTLPHAELLVPEKNLSEFRGKFLPENSFVGAEPGDEGFRNGAYGTQSEGHAAFAAMINLIDKQVGEVIAKLKELGIEKNTLIIFSSDNGPHLEGGADPDYFNSSGSLRGYKRDLYEGGVREPMIVWWPGKIQAKLKSDHISAFWDVMPTVAEIAGIETPEHMDGISFLPTLINQQDQKQHEYLYWEFHGESRKRALLMDEWKLIELNVNNPKKSKIELYNLAVDSIEKNDVSAEYPEMVKNMMIQMENARNESEVFSFKSK